MFFTEVASLLAVTLGLGLLAYLIKQPLVIAYIVAGVLVGPEAFGWLQSSHELEIFSQAGIVFLLFSVGLHLNPLVLKEVGLVSTLTGLGQVIFTTLIGLALCLSLGFSPVEAVVMAIALTFSSTIIIMKLITDRQDLDQLYAKISIGFLLVQDIVATIALVGLPLLSSGGEQSILVAMSWLLAKSAAIILVIGLLAVYVLPKLMPKLASNTELLFLFSITWGLGIAALIDFAGLSLEVGALVAGVALAGSSFAEEMASRLKPLRDFFIVTFFLLLGATLELGALSSVILPASLLSIFVLVGNPLIVYIIMQLLGYKRKVGFQAGLTVAQISEFSLIFVALAGVLYSLPGQVVATITLVGIITIAVSTYMILYSDQIFTYIDPILRKIPIPALRNQKPGKTAFKHGDLTGILWFGASPHYHHIVDILKQNQIKINLVDYDPELLKEIKAPRLHAHYGDASDADFLSQLPWNKVKHVISLIPDDNINQLIAQQSRKYKHIDKVVLLAKNKSGVERLKKHGAHLVIDPFELTLGHIRKLSDLFK